MQEDRSLFDQLSQPRNFPCYRTCLFFSPSSLSIFLDEAFVTSYKRDKRIGDRSRKISYRSGIAEHAVAAGQRPANAFPAVSRSAVAPPAAFGRGDHEERVPGVGDREGGGRLAEDALRVRIPLAVRTVKIGGRLAEETLPKWVPIAVPTVKIIVSLSVNGYWKF